MNEEEIRQVESSQRQHFEVLEHQDRAFLICQGIDYNLFSMLKPKIMQDGNQWCVLYGDDLQTGIAGFGDTPHKAIVDWNSEWNKSIESESPEIFPGTKDALNNLTITTKD